ncbi:MAG: hypothetical protein ACRDTU_20535 [Micromonosporaceae bacterium]
MVAIVLESQSTLQAVTGASVFTINHTSQSEHALVALVALRASTASAVTGVTDDGGNTWVFGGMGRHPTGSARIEMWYALHADAVSSVTVTQQAAVKHAVNVTEWSGLRDTSAFDSGVDTFGSSVTVLDSGQLTSLSPNTVVFGAVASTTTGTRTFDSTTGFTQLTPFRSTGGSDVIASAAYRVVSTVGTYHSVWTENAGRNFGGITVALRADGEPPGGSPVTVGRYNLPVAVGADTLLAGYYSTADLTTQSTAVTRVLMVVHGVDRNADDYCQYGIDATEQAGQMAVTRVVAPHFIRDIDIDSDDGETLYWDSDWDDGDRSRTSPFTRPFRVSSYEVADRIVDQAVSSFPNLAEVVFVGNSAGGQYLNRYAAGNDLPGTYTGISFRWIVMSTSSYLYFNARRYHDGTGQMEALTSAEQSACPGWNTYKWGLNSLNPYMSAAGDLAQKYHDRDIRHFCGGEDNDPNDPNLDTTCASNWQGTQRLDRMNKYALHLNDVYGHIPQPFTEVPGIDHSADLMMLSAPVQAAMFSP